MLLDWRPVSKCDIGHDYTVQPDGSMKCKNCTKRVVYNVVSRKWENK